MKLISEIITELETIKAKHGDIECRKGPGSSEIDHIDVEEYTDGSFVAWLSEKEEI